MFFGLRHIDADDSGVRMGTADNGGVQHTREGKIVREPRLPANLVDRVGAGHARPDQ